MRGAPLNVFEFDALEQIIGSFSGLDTLMQPFPF